LEPTACHMSAKHSDCRYAIRGDRVPVTGTRYVCKYGRAHENAAEGVRNWTHKGCKMFTTRAPGNNFAAWWTECRKTYMYAGWNVRRQSCAAFSVTLERQSRGRSSQLAAQWMEDRERNTDGGQRGGRDRRFTVGRAPVSRFIGLSAAGPRRRGLATGDGRATRGRRGDDASAAGDKCGVRWRTRSITELTICTAAAGGRRRGGAPLSCPCRLLDDQWSMIGTAAAAQSYIRRSLCLTQTHLNDPVALYSFLIRTKLQTVQF